MTFEPGPDAGPPRQAGDEIARLETVVMEAVRERDMATLDSLLGDDFTLTTGRPGHEVRDRGEWLSVTEHDYVLDDYEFEELIVQAYAGCAVARSRYRQRGRMGEQARNTTYRMTDVWVQQAGRWQLQARHAQPVAGD